MYLRQMEWTYALLFLSTKIVFVVKSMFWDFPNALVMGFCYYSYHLLTIEGYEWLPKAWVPVVGASFVLLGIYGRYQDAREKRLKNEALLTENDLSEEKLRTMKLENDKMEFLLNEEKKDAGVPIDKNEREGSN